VKKIYTFALNIVLSIALFWLGFIDFAREKTIFVRNFVVDCVASAFVLPKTKFPILLSRSQVAMHSHYKKFGRFTGASVINMNGHFIAKKAVNSIA